MASGTSAVHVPEGDGESLAGRLRPLHLHPFTFRELLRYHGIERDPTDLQSPTGGDRTARIRFGEYLEAGGMPELYRSRRPVERLEETIDLVLLRDIIELFERARSSVLKGMFRIPPPWPSIVRD